MVNGSNKACIKACSVTVHTSSVAAEPEVEITGEVKDAGVRVYVDEQQLT